MDRWTIYANPYATRQEAFRTLRYGEKRTLKINWKAEIHQQQSSISSVNWDVGAGGVVSVSNESQDGITTEALIEGTARGRTKMDVEVTLADGQILHQRFDFTVN